MFGIRRTKADALFSDYIRELAGWSCENCKRQFVKKESLGGSGLECSHFWSRRNKSVRWDKENAAALCTYCHRRMGENPADHAAFFIKRLGNSRYDALGVRARTPQKVDEKVIAMGLKMELERLKNERKVLKDYK